MDTNLGYQSLSFSSSNKSGGGVLEVLGLGKLTGKLNNGTIDTLTFNGFHTNFEEVNLSGFLEIVMKDQTQAYLNTVSGTIASDGVYGNSYNLSGSNGGITMQIKQSEIILTSTANQYMRRVDDAGYMLSELIFSNLNFSNYYDINNYTMNLDISSIIDDTVDASKIYTVTLPGVGDIVYISKEGDTVRDVMKGLGIDISNDNIIDIKNIERFSNSFGLLISALNTTVTINAKEGDNAPPQMSDKLIDYSCSRDKPSEKISIGDLVITIDGVDNIFEITNDTTVQDFKTFMANLGFTYDRSTKDFVGGPNGRNIDVSGSSKIINMINPVISKYQYNVTIKKDENGNYYKNLSALSGVEGDGTIKINENEINIRQSWSINDLISVINDANAGVEASFDDVGNALNITRTDGYLSYIDFEKTERNSQILLSNLNFITKNIDSSYNTNKNNQYLPDSVSITVTKDDKSCNIGNITSSNDEFGRSFATIVKNMSANDSNVMLGSFNIDISKLGEHIVTVNEATAAIPDITVANLSGATNYIEMVEKIGTLTSNNYNLKITKISDTQMQISGTDNNGNDLGTKIIEKKASDDKFYYTISQYDENGKEKGSVTFEVKNDDFNIGDIYTRTTNVKIEATTSEGGSLDGIDDVINSVNEQIDENNKKIINEFVSAYNNVAKEMSKINKLSSSSTSYSDKLTISELMKSFNNTINQVDTTYGSTIGLTFSYDSNLNTSVLKLDTDKFLSALDTNTETVTNYLSKVSEKITSSIDLFVKSKFASMYSTSNLKLDEYNNKISSLKSKNDELMTKLEADYKIIEQLFNQSSNQYSELFSALL